MRINKTEVDVDATNVYICPTSYGHVKLNFTVENEEIDSLLSFLDVKDIVSYLNSLGYTVNNNISNNKL